MTGPTQCTVRTERAVDHLRSFINGNADAFKAVTAFLLSSLHPDVQYPVMLVHGEEGSAKSTLLRIVQQLIDPNEGDLLTLPSDLRDFAITADNAWILPIDNLSKLSEEMSDAICRLSTGGGFKTRALYTDRSLVVFKARRPVLLNGISQFAQKGDLLNRSLYLELTYIPESKRRPERVFWKDFAQAQPLVLGALLDAVSAGLRCMHQVSIQNFARLGDAAEFLTAVEIGMGWRVGEFNTLLITSGDRGIQEALEACLVRHSFATWLAQSGVHPKIMQDLCRHSSVELTLKVYTHTRLEDERVAVAGLPDLSVRPVEARKTGTENLGSSLGSESEMQGSSMPKHKPKPAICAAPPNAPPTLLESTESAPETGSEADESWRWRRDSNPRVTDLQSVA
jgi:hypothetical protein